MSNMTELIWRRTRSRTRIRLKPDPDLGPDPESRGEMEQQLRSSSGAAKESGWAGWSRTGTGSQRAGNHFSGPHCGRSPHSWAQFRTNSWPLRTCVGDLVAHPLYSPPAPPPLFRCPLRVCWWEIADESECETCRACAVFFTVIVCCCFPFYRPCKVKSGAMPNCSNCLENSAKTW